MSVDKMPLTLSLAVSFELCLAYHLNAFLPPEKGRNLTIVAGSIQSG